MNSFQAFTFPVLISLMMWGLSMGSNFLNINHQIAEETEVTVPLTVDNLAAELRDNDIKHWRVVLAQAILEAGWNFDSKICQRTNNFIGMRIPGNRASTRIGEYKSYSVYENWQDCVQDIKLWQEGFWKGGERLAYIDKMHRVWAQSPVYERDLKIIVKKLDKRFPPDMDREENEDAPHPALALISFVKDWNNQSIQ